MKRLIGAANKRVPLSTDAIEASLASKFAFLHKCR